MNVNNYECPKCHNVFPEANKFLHDQYCTVSKPVPLNQSRVAFLKEQEKNKKKEPVKHIFEPNYEAIKAINNNNNNQRQTQQKNEEDKEFTCWLCGSTLKEKDKADHMLCHQLEAENEEFRRNNPKVENSNNNNINRPNRDNRESARMQEVNPRNRDNNNRLQRVMNFNEENLGRQNQNTNRNRNLKRSQVKFSDWQIFDFGNLRESLNKMDNPTDEDILEQLPESEIDDISQLSEERQECIICLIKFKKSDKITMLPCTHMFHSYCVETWLKARDFCPVCKLKISRRNFGV